MLLKVHVTPNARHVEVRKLSEDALEVKVDARPEKGQANKRLVEILSEEFDVPSSRIVILRGIASRDKLVRID